MRMLIGLIAWLAARAGADIGIADAAQPAPWSDATTADRAGRLVAVPQDALEPEVTRSLGVHWALWPPSPLSCWSSQSVISVASGGRRG